MDCGLGNGDGSDFRRNRLIQNRTQPVPYHAFVKTLWNRAGEPGLRKHSHVQLVVLIDFSNMIREFIESRKIMGIDEGRGIQLLRDGGIPPVNRNGIGLCSLSKFFREIPWVRVIFESDDKFS